MRSTRRRSGRGWTAAARSCATRSTAPSANSATRASSPRRRPWWSRKSAASSSATAANSRNWKGARPLDPNSDLFAAAASLDSLEPVGWKLGLDRMWKLTTALGLPQRRFASVHVVGTNGQSSVTRMVAALLEAHGVTAGACLSPHTSRWTERTLIRGEEITPVAWAEAVAQVAAAAEGVDRALEDGDQ